MCVCMCSPSRPFPNLCTSVAHLSSSHFSSDFGRPLKRHGWTTLTQGIKNVSPGTIRQTLWGRNCWRCWSPAEVGRCGGGSVKIWTGSCRASRPTWSIMAPRFLYFAFASHQLLLMLCHIRRNEKVTTPATGCWHTYVSLLIGFWENCCHVTAESHPHDACPNESMLSIASQICKKSYRICLCNHVDHLRSPLILGGSHRADCQYKRMATGTTEHKPGDAEHVTKSTNFGHWGTGNNNSTPKWLLLWDLGDQLVTGLSCNSERVPVCNE